MNLRRTLKLLLLAAAKYGWAFAAARALLKESFAIVAWHGVSLDREHELFPEYFVTPETLDRRLHFLRRHYRIVALDEALRQHASGEIVPRQVVLTFDDGMYDLLPRAAPVLRLHCAPATVYVVSSSLERPTIALSMAVRELFLRTPRTHAPEDLYTDRSPPSLASPEARRECGSVCVARMHRECPTYDEKLAFARRTAQQLQLDWDALVGDRHWDYLQPAELRELQHVRITMQLHSQRHQTVRELQTDLAEDTQACRRTIEAVTGQLATHYCYPSGIWFRACWPLLASSGVRSAVTCKLGPNFADTPALALRRYVDHEQLHQLEFESIMSGFDWWLRRLLGQAHRSVPTEALDETTSLY